MGTCTATKAGTNQTCRKHPPTGSTVCRSHGAATPQAKVAAARRAAHARLAAEYADQAGPLGWGGDPTHPDPTNDDPGPATTGASGH